MLTIFGVSTFAKFASEQYNFLTILIFTKNILICGKNAAFRCGG